MASCYAKSSNLPFLTSTTATHALPYSWTFLDTASLLCLSASSKALRSRVCERWLLAAVTARDFGAAAAAAAAAATPPQQHPATPRGTWLAALQVFHAAAPAAAARAIALRRVLPRAQRVWEALRAFCAARALALPLLPPSPAADRAAAEARLGVRFPHALRALLGASAGQEYRNSNRWGGLLGGVSVYDLQCSSFLLPHGLAGLVAAAAGHQSAGFPAGLVPIAQGAAVPMFLDCGVDSPCRGMVWRGLAHGYLQPAAAGAPPLPPALRHASEGPYEDALLHWLEEYAARLARGEHAIESTAGPEVEEEEAAGGGGGGRGDAAAAAATAAAAAAPRYISAFSDSLARGGSQCSTHGLVTKVATLSLAHATVLPRRCAVGAAEYGARCSEVLATAAAEVAAAAAPAQPPAPAPAHEPPRQSVYAYRLQMWREAGAPPAFEGEHGALTLASRAWVTAEPDGSEQKSGGPGVIGLHPVLARGGRVFRYASQTAFKRLPGRMKGEMRFQAEGSQRELAAEVAEFVMGKGGAEPFLYF